MAMLIGALTLFAYLLGSVSSAVLVCRIWGLPDPRQHGSHNPGATNVLRLGGKLPAVLVLLFDILKGTIPVWGGYFLGLDPLALALVGAAACLGHIYPLFFGFKGGKGVATAFGAMAPIGWDMTGALIVTWLGVALLTRYSSLGAIVTCLVAPVYTYLFKSQYTASVALVCVLILWRHRANILRLWRGTEPKLGQKKRPAE
ncbi:acyl-phosphate glycerol-3-phosphate acyltransferase [Ferrimonas balearica DSM 9799]|uniref:Glycerol-3-phosphate acyltransferase n=1 Tax=Ferrimonas balearica (strain DSM 9799 / CCM 4581 / KCTC 23876 / PAT) TaxID=550540 RepID=E1SWK4_FERBD|nr:acyl-phosphate glycerol-3-phosphate acyltransferase [Ferrimonas balearica DSM 9799]MBY6094302.1 glycerol-3-phosphate 1-O-acyltransferase PlsY [Ferrimonas balearica]